jgi:protoheme IX farnesyltransferase
MSDFETTAPRTPVEAAAPSIRMADLLELTKPRITFMVMLTTAVGFILPQQGPLELALFFHALLATGLLVSGASTLNQVLERGTDARMHRTANRPLPAGRIDPDAALAFGVGLSVAGLTYLALAVNLLTALLGVAALVAYVFVYTPLKRVSSLSTIVGAVPGAIPPVMGWTAARDAVEPGAWVLFGILFLWQLPHFLSIAWMCREDYARGGFPMLSVLDPGGRRLARQSILWAAALVPVSLLPSVLGLTGGIYFTGTLVAGLVFLASTFAFAPERSHKAARRVLLVSVLYLPAILAVMLLDRVAL